MSDYGTDGLENTRDTRPPRRRKPYTLRAVLSNLWRDIVAWWRHR